MTTIQKFKQTEIGLIPKDWELSELQKIASIQTGKGTKKLDEGKYKIIGANGVIGYSNEYLEEVPFVYTGRVGTIGLTNYYEGKPVWISDNVLYLKGNGIFTKFIYYALRRIDYSYLNVGSTQPLVKQSDLKKLKIGLPRNKSELVSITTFLSNIDSKIELLQKQNETLEKIGQAIFKQWFVDFEFPDEEGKPYKSSGGEMVESELGEIPKGWSVGELGDLIKKINNSTKPGDHLKNRKYVPIDLLAMKKVSIDSYLPYTEAQSSLVGFEKDDILIGAMRVYFHRVNLAPFSGVTRTTTFVLRPKDKTHLSYCLFLLNQNETIDFANSHSKGSTMPYAVWNHSLENMPIKIPDENTLAKFNELVYPLISKIRDTIFENESLIKIRDSLLPKLMSGEIRVK